ncbi:hypothetical protein U9M48_016768 [Paspalum notatum var. saurae]|uniref:Uncharacterized protein n=1 Tax=Paspalum notatum var. saurae TaxID=547442 RepID=A0AAQ3T7A7_PASNO
MDTTVQRHYSSRLLLSNHHRQKQQQQHISKTQQDKYGEADAAHYGYKHEGYGGGGWRRTNPKIGTARALFLHNRSSAFSDSAGGVKVHDYYKKQEKHREAGAGYDALARYGGAVVKEHDDDTHEEMKYGKDGARYGAHYYYGGAVVKENNYKQEKKYGSAGYGAQYGDAVVKERGYKQQEKYVEAGGAGYGTHYGAAAESHGEEGAGYGAYYGGVGKYQQAAYGGAYEKKDEYIPGHSSFSAYVKKDGPDYNAGGYKSQGKAGKRGYFSGGYHDEAYYESDSDSDEESDREKAFPPRIPQGGVQSYQGYKWGQKN